MNFNEYKYDKVSNEINEILIKNEMKVEERLGILMSIICSVFFNKGFSKEILLITLEMIYDKSFIQYQNKKNNEM
jgi:predicted house-cleaning noncanonical NTP pyrophosphatase (MazG superfamily)